MFSDQLISLFGYAAGVLTAVSFVPYVIDIVRGRVRPQRMSWFIWLVLGCIAFGSQWAEGARASLWLPGAANVGIIVVFLLSLRYGVGGTSRLDVSTLALSLFGLLLWWVTDIPALAIAAVIVADAMGGVLTMRKVWIDPSSETVPLWLFNALGGICATLAVGMWDPILLSYPVYIALFNLSMIGINYAGRVRKKTS